MISNYFSKVSLFLFVFLYSGVALAQTLYVPGGITTGISESSNSNVGIGVSAPSQKLSVVGNLQLQGGSRLLYFTGGHAYIRASDSGRNLYFQVGGTSTRMFINGSNGNVGVGTTSPAEKLDIVGNLKISGNAKVFSGTKYLEFSDWQLVPNCMTITANDHSNYKIPLVLAASSFYFDSGSVGIGTATTGTYKLAVEGTIGAREVVVTLDNWADHVFKPNYKLRSLGEVERFIKENNHLPDVPSETKVLENGVGLGEMNTILLQKVEELTLYVIELQKQIDALKANQQNN